MPRWVGYEWLVQRGAEITGVPKPPWWRPFELVDWRNRCVDAALMVAMGREWCKTHSSNGRGPSPFGEACHYAALQMATHPEWAIEPCSWLADYLTEEETK